MCGTPEYASPELVYEYGYDYKSEIWALGIIFFVLNYGYYPFGSFDSFLDVQNNIDLLYHFEFIQYPDCDFNTSNFLKIKQMLCFEPDNRINLKDLCFLFK